MDLDIEWLARVRDALAVSRFLLGSPDQRFVWDMEGEPIEAMTVSQRAHLLRLSRRYSRLLPDHLVASEALCSSLSAAERTACVKTAKRRRAARLKKASAGHG